MWKEFALEVQSSQIFTWCSSSFCSEPCTPVPDAVLGAENTEVNTMGPVPLMSQMEQEADLHGTTIANGSHIYQGPPVN